MRASSTIFILGLCLFLNVAMAGDEYFVVGTGINLSSFNVEMNNREPEQNFRTAGAVMAGYQMPTGDNATVLSLGFETRGTSGNLVRFGEEQIGYEYRLNYLQLLLQYKWLMSITSMTSAYLSPNLGLAWLLGAEEEVGNLSHNIEQGTSNFDLEIGVMVGTQVSLGNHGLFFEGGYGYGLTEVRDEFQVSGTLKNSVVKFRLGLLYGL